MGEVEAVVVVVEEGGEDGGGLVVLVGSCVSFSGVVSLCVEFVVALPDGVLLLVVAFDGGLVVFVVLDGWVSLPCDGGGLGDGLGGGLEEEEELDVGVACTLAATRQSASRTRRARFMVHRGRVADAHNGEQRHSERSNPSRECH